MNNEQFIKSMNTQELADYIKSVYIAGLLSARNPDCNAKMIDYKSWLQEERTDSE